MNIIKTAIDGVVIIESRIFEDARGYDWKIYMEQVDSLGEVHEICFTERLRKPI